MKLNFAASNGQPKRRAAPNLSYYSCVMALMALGSFNFLPLMFTSLHLLTTFDFCR